MRVNRYAPPSEARRGWGRASTRAPTEIRLREGDRKIQPSRKGDVTAKRRFLGACGIGSAHGDRAAARIGCHRNGRNLE
jgi:hypothetical protein